MSSIRVCFSVLSLIVLPLASAQTRAGPYAVARAGAAFNPEIRLDNNAVTYKVAPTGEIGGGYDFGPFRLEQMLGYSASDAKDAPTRARAYSLTVSAFADIPVNAWFVPYVGGGTGAVRLDTRVPWIENQAVEARSWGPFWHLDAGVGIHFTPMLTLECGGRYSRTFSMRGVGDGDRFVEVSQLRGSSATAGLRFAF